MRLLMRGLMIVTGVVAALLTYGFYTQAAWATRLWPWPDGRLTYIFVASIAAAIALPNLWIAASGKLFAIAPGALNLAVSHLAMAAFLYNRGTSGVALALGAMGILELAAFFWSRTVPVVDARPTPRAVRLSFLLFALVLIATGLALVTHAAHVFPWPLKPETSVLIGWIFWGASIYFLYGFLRPVWENACGQLLGFLAYDLVLIVPYVSHFDKVKPEHLLSLQVYVTVLVYSGLLALYFLLIDRRTRFGSSMRVAPAPSAAPSAGR